MNINTYLRIKQAATDVFDPSKGLTKKNLEAYNNYTPEMGTGNDYTNKDGNRLLIRTTKDKYSGDIMGPVDPKSRRTRVLMDATGQDQNRRYLFADASVNPYQNLRYGDPVDKVKGNVRQVLWSKGYGGADLAGIGSNTATIAGRLNQKGENVIENPTGTIYVDDKGNIMARSKGVVLGRRTGRVLGGTLGGVGGYYGGNLLADKLGLNAADAGGLKRFGGSLLRLGGAGLGAYGGGWAGARLGSGIGNYFDPQKGTKIRVRGFNPNEDYSQLMK